MYAVVTTGGKQYRVEAGSELIVRTDRTGRWRSKAINPHFESDFVGVSRVLLHDLARTRRAQNVVDRIDRNPVAGKLLRKNRIRNAFEGVNHAGDRRQEN